VNRAVKAKTNSVNLSEKEADILFSKRKPRRHKGMRRGQVRGKGRGMGLVRAKAMPLTGRSDFYPGPIRPRQEQPGQSISYRSNWDKLTKPRQKKKQVAVLDPNLCKGCGQCEQVCPTGAITINESLHINTGLCAGCGQCVSVCPTQALSLQDAE
jgi:formate hydrogenlyase subunit 6/NADH:ubiquinone oxidoreductase subunit I